MKLLHYLFDLLFPPKCVLCGKVLEPSHTDLCPSCRADTPEASCAGRKFPYLAKCASLWYYEGSVRNSILRFKFRGRRSSAPVYGCLLAMKIAQALPPFDILTWVPISRFRRWTRGYDQVELIAQAVGRELGITPQPVLLKRRHNRAQSGLKDAARRRANVLGVYRVTDQPQISGKRILLLDDIITTGATASECARTLLTAGAKEVFCATVAISPNQRKKQ